MSDLHSAQYEVSALPYRIAVICYVYDTAGRMLMLHRRKLPNIDMHSPIGGKLEVSRGESPHECAAREVQEEAGIEASPQDMRLLGMVSERAYQGEMHWLIFCFEYRRRVTSDEVRLMDFEEGRLEWVMPSDVASRNIPHTDREILWPLIQKHPQGFFAVDIDCGGPALSSVLRESHFPAPTD